MKESGIILPTIILVIVVQIINPVFLSFSNIMNVLRSTGFTMITAIGMTFVLISAGLDLCVGSVLALGGVSAAMAVLAGVPIPIAVLIGLLVGAAIGLFNGYIIVKFEIPPLIMTLGMYYMARGIVYIITKGVPVYPLPEAFNNIEQTELFGIPVIVITAILLAIVGHIVLTRTTYGRAVYAIGGNPEAAELSGIDIQKIRMSVYVISATLATLTGIFMAGRLSSAQAGAGMGFELTVIAAVIIGGTSTFGGAGTILGSVVGALFMSILANSMTLIKVSVYWQRLVIGAILVLAVIIDQRKRKMQLK